MKVSAVTKAFVNAVSRCISFTAVHGSIAVAVSTVITTSIFQQSHIDDYKLALQLREKTQQKPTTSLLNFFASNYF